MVNKKNYEAIRIASRVKSGRTRRGYSIPKADLISFRYLSDALSLSSISSPDRSSAYIARMRSCCAHRVRYTREIEKDISLFFMGRTRGGG